MGGTFLETDGQSAPAMRAVRFDSTVRALRQLGLGAGDPVPWGYEVFADPEHLRLVGPRRGIFFELAPAITEVTVGETASGLPFRQVELALILTVAVGDAIFQLPIVPLSSDGQHTLKWHGSEAHALADRLDVLPRHVVNAG
jgi:hypothetical protein